MEECDIKYDLLQFKMSGHNSENDTIILDDDDFIQTTLGFFNTGEINETHSVNFEHTQSLISPDNNHINDEQINLIDLTSCDDFDLNDIFMLSSQNYSLNTEQNECLTLKKEAFLEIKSEYDFKSVDFNFQSIPELILIDDEESQTINHKLSENSSITIDEHFQEKSLESNSKTVLKCPTCFKIFNKSYNYKRHLFLHKVKSNELDTDKNFKVNNCLKCNKTILDKSNFVKHLKLCNPEGIRNFLDDEKMNRSKESSNRFKCEVCEKVFSKRFNYQRHLRVHFLNEANRNGDNLKSDYKDNKKPLIELYECARCGRKFTTKELLNSHYTKWHLTQNKCELCSEIFNEKIDFIKHLNLNHSIQFKFECKYCRKTFRYVSQYSQHCQTHLNQMRFNSNERIEENNLDRNLSNKQISCDICGKTFSKSFNLERHLYTLHLKESNPTNESSYLLNDEINYESNVKQKQFYQQNKLNYQLYKINLNK
ncbi:unnamed protein product [Brachionus calyciflorus]|uniref:C2H2-type domain-containing protein n=1 Tax=Brachionus calyciflorus TaxID=104777 RepID=A0A813VS70_9BILA|nr:unnamed protein product [Brachionus calyciflorus]